MGGGHQNVSFVKCIYAFPFTLKADNGVASPEMYSRCCHSILISI